MLTNKLMVMNKQHNTDKQRTKLWWESDIFVKITTFLLNLERISSATIPLFGKNIWSSPAPPVFAEHGQREMAALIC